MGDYKKVVVRAALACALVAGVPALKGDGLGPMMLGLGGSIDGEIIVSVGDSLLGDPYLFGNIPLCLDRGGSVTVTRVGFGENLGDLNVDAFTLRPFHRPFDNDGVNLGEPIGLEGRALSVKHDVSQACQPEDSSRMEFAELVLQVSRRTQKTAFGRGIVVTYLSDGVERRLGISLGIGLCAPADAPIESVCD